MLELEEIFGKTDAIFHLILTQRILEALKGLKGKRLIFASSPSLFGNLCLLHHKNFGGDLVILRYFTLYGERQRPGMAFHRFFYSIFTYVDDMEWINKI